MKRLEYAEIAALYDHVGPYAARPDVDFWVGEAVAARGPVLELGCGTGRVLLPTARAGLTITGLDGSPEMLAVCREKLAASAEELRERVTLVEGRLESFSLGRRFSLITMPFRPFQHLLTVEEQLACLSCVREHLAPGGRFVFDVFDPDPTKLTGEDVGQVQAEEGTVDMPGGSRLVRSHRVDDCDVGAQVLTVTFFYRVSEHDGRDHRREQSIRLRWFHRWELEHLLVRAGFDVIAVYSDYERTRWADERKGDLVFVAEEVRDDGG